MKIFMFFGGILLVTASWNISGGFALAGAGAMFMLSAVFESNKKS